jgi:hypothetical protein
MGEFSKKYKVTIFFNYVGMPLPSTSKTKYFKTYWGANLWSWFAHNIFGYSCKIWKKDGKEENDLDS